MKRFAPILILIVLVVALVFVNRGINKATQTGSSDNSAAASAQKTPKTPPAAPVAGSSDDLPPIITIGSLATAKFAVTAGWVYDIRNQTNPAPLVAAVQAIENVVRESDGKAAVEIVDLDVPKSDVPPSASQVNRLGVFINGTPIPPATGGSGPDADNLGSPQMPASYLTAILTAHINGH
jgi:hypothetical protein